jgi:hypothetical protein
MPSSCPVVRYLVLRPVRRPGARNVQGKGQFPVPWHFFILINVVPIVTVLFLTSFLTMVHSVEASPSTSRTSMSTSSVQHSVPSESNHDMVKQQLAVAKTVLLQAVDLLDNHLTSDEQITVHSQHLPGSTIGKTS